MPTEEAEERAVSREELCPFGLKAKEPSARPRKNSRKIEVISTRGCCLALKIMAEEGKQKAHVY